MDDPKVLDGFIKTEDEERVCEIICSAIADEKNAKREYNELKGLIHEDKDSIEILDRIIRDESFHKQALENMLKQKYNCECLSSAEK